MVYLLSFCPCFSLCLSLVSQPFWQARASLLAQRQSVQPTAPRSRMRQTAPTPVIFSFGRVGFSSQMRFVSDDHLYISAQSSGLRVCVELHRISSDVEIRPLNGCALLRA